MTRARAAVEGATLVVLGGRRVPVQTDALVLLDAPAADTATFARTLHLDLVGHGGFARATWEDLDSAARFQALVARARAEPRVVCVAAAGGEGAEPAGAARRRLVMERVLPALVRHFDAVEARDDDGASWLLTAIVAATIATKTDAATLDAFATAITASLGHGDATSTRQNVQAAQNLEHYARRTSRDEAERVMARHPVLVGLSLLGDARRWPKDDGALAPALREALAPVGARHARAAVQIGTRAIDDHGTSPARVLAILEAVLAVPGARSLVPGSRALDLRRAALARGLGEAVLAGLFVAR